LKVEHEIRLDQFDLAFRALGREIEVGSGSFLIKNPPA
jgi:hypothetical protein